MIINQINNTNDYIIKIIKNNIDIYNHNVLEEITNKIINKIKKQNKLEKLIILEFYPIKKYGTLIILKNIKTILKTENEIEVKIKDFNKEERRISLEYPLKGENPWFALTNKYKINLIILKFPNHIISSNIFINIRKRSFNKFINYHFHKFRINIFTHSNNISIIMTLT